MTVDEHIFVCVDEWGVPIKAFRDREAAWDAVASDSYSNEEIVDVHPDVPLMETRSGGASG